MQRVGCGNTEMRIPASIATLNQQKKAKQVAKQWQLSAGKKYQTP
jgi:hypothetical protein